MEEESDMEAIQFLKSQLRANAPPQEENCNFEDVEVYLSQSRSESSTCSEYRKDTANYPLYPYQLVSYVDPEECDAPSGKGNTKKEKFPKETNKMISSHSSQPSNSSATSSITGRSETKRSKKSLQSQHNTKFLERLGHGQEFQDSMAHMNIFSQFLYFMRMYNKTYCPERYFDEVEEISPFLEDEIFIRLTQFMVDVKTDQVKQIKNFMDAFDESFNHRTIARNFTSTMEKPEEHYDRVSDKILSTLVSLRKTFQKPSFKLEAMKWLQLYRQTKYSQEDFMKRNVSDEDTYPRSNMLKNLNMILCDLVIKLSFKQNEHEIFRIPVYNQTKNAFFSDEIPPNVKTDIRNIFTNKINSMETEDHKYLQDPNKNITNHSEWGLYYFLQLYSDELMGRLCEQYVLKSGRINEMTTVPIDHIQFELLIYSTRSPCNSCEPLLMDEWPLLYINLFNSFLTKLKQHKQINLNHEPLGHEKKVVKKFAYSIPTDVKHRKSNNKSDLLYVLSKNYALSVYNPDYVLSKLAGDYSFEDICQRTYFFAQNDIIKEFEPEFRDVAHKINDAARQIEMTTMMSQNKIISNMQEVQNIKFMGKN